MMKEGDIELLSNNLVCLYDIASKLADQEQIPHRDAFMRLCQLLDMATKVIEPILMLQMTEKAAVYVKEIAVGTGNMMISELRRSHERE